MVERYKLKTAPPPSPPKGEGRRAPAATKGKPIVRIVYLPEGQNRAYLLAEGPEQSELRFVHNGNFVVISNMTDGEKNFVRVEPNENQKDPLTQIEEEPDLTGQEVTFHPKQNSMSMKSNTGGTK